jgi:hypothetical protein
VRIFLDANVLFSASNVGSALHAFVHRLCEAHTVVTSFYALDEARRNVTIKRPGWLDDFKGLTRCVECVLDAPLRFDVVLAEKDRPILGAAIAAGCDYLLTGDKKDFGHLYNKEIGGVTVVSYTALAQKILN